MQKECLSLAKAGYRVYVVVADGLGDAERSGVTILDAGLVNRGRLRRMVFTTRRVLQRALDTQATVFHLHDPELMPAALRLKRHGFTVIFDAHEDLPVQIRNKTYLRFGTRTVLAGVMKLYQRYVCRRIDAVVTATPYIRDTFVPVNPATIDVNNFPILEEFPVTSRTFAEPYVCYVGGLSIVRGIQELVSSLTLVTRPIRLKIAGNFFDVQLQERLQKNDGWAAVDHLGWVDRAGIRQILSGAVAGIVTLHPVPNYLQSLPVKMFEYMAAGIPVIASDFPLWREIVDTYRCGLLVDPHDPGAIARAIDALVEDPELARTMGENGHRAAEERYNWSREEEKLLRLYETLTR